MIYQDVMDFVTDWRATDYSQSFHCFYCGVKTKRHGPSTVRRTKEHLIPKERLNLTVVQCNIVWACQECNSHRNSLTIDEFRESNYWRKSKCRIQFFCEEILGRPCPSEYGSSRAYFERLQGYQRRQLKQATWVARGPKENFFIQLRGYAARYFPQYTECEVRRIVEDFFQLVEEKESASGLLSKRHGWIFSKLKGQSLLSSEVLYHSYNAWKNR